MLRCETPNESGNITDNVSRLHNRLLENQLYIKAGKCDSSVFSGVCSQVRSQPDGSRQSEMVSIGISSVHKTFTWSLSSPQAVGQLKSFFSPAPILKVIGFLSLLLSFLCPIYPLLKRLQRSYYNTFSD